MTHSTTPEATLVEDAQAIETAETVEELPSFSELGLSEKVLAAVADMGYETPTPVQAQSIPYVLEGRDLLAAAQTGTGKTAAFLLPSLSRLPHASRGRGPYLLVLTPTRELAQQIEDVCRSIVKRTKHHSVTVVGGVGYEPQKRALRRGCDVLVATPGRLVDLIEQGEAHLGDVTTLVLDEADRMLDMGFLPAMRKIVGETPGSRQTLLFSATLDEKAIGGIRDLVNDPAVVEIAHKGTVAETIDQFVLPVSADAKNGILTQILKAEGPEHVIVFTRTKRRADTCCKRLHKAGISCAPIHGDRNQNQRNRALESFRTGKVDVLVATDVLARGIDVSDVRYVINFDIPTEPDDYIHRIGRTGRAGEAGWALTVVTKDDVRDLYDCERLMGQVVPTWPKAEEVDCGEDALELDPNRSCDERPAGRKRQRKRGGKASARINNGEEAAERRERKPARKRRGEDAEAEGGEQRRRGSRGEHGGSAAKGGKRERTEARTDERRDERTRDAGAGKPKLPPARTARKPRRERAEEDFELLTPKEIGAIQRSAGRRGEDERRGRGGKSNGRRGADMRGGERSGRGGRGNGGGRGRADRGNAGRSNAGRNGQPKQPASKSGRRVGDRRGRSGGVH